MNLIADIGNSSAKAALFDGETLLRRARLDGGGSGGNSGNDGSNVGGDGDVDFGKSLRAFIGDAPIDACAYALVGAEDHPLVAHLRALSPRLLRVTGETPTPLAMRYETPETLGADRLAAAVGAYTLRPTQPLLIIDAGTCITYDYVAGRAYLGGNISPGLGMRLRALHQQTARLPLVTAEGPCPPIGQDTETALRAGVIISLKHEIRGYADAFYKSEPDGCVFLTGGNADRLAPRLPASHHEALVEVGLNSILRHTLKHE